MSSSMIHRCQHCGCETELSNWLSVFSEDPHCRQCGLSASESETKMQEDLSSLFSRHLNVENPPEPIPPVNYITQHYHHSGHQVSTNGIPVEEVLTQHNINPSTLSLSQLTFFREAPRDQQLRLIEIWRLSPPQYGSPSLAQGLGNWPSTTMQLEEEMARIRLSRMSNGMVEDQGNQMHAMEDTQENRPATRGDGRNAAEPYIVSGYESLAQRDYNLKAEQQQLENTKASFSPFGSAISKPYNRAQDPVYRSQEWWQHVSEQQPMEHQYGAFDQMNQFRAPSSTYVKVDGATEDEEML